MSATGITRRICPRKIWVPILYRTGPNKELAVDQIKATVYQTEFDWGTVTWAAQPLKDRRGFRMVDFFSGLMIIESRKTVTDLCVWIESNSDRMRTGYTSLGYKKAVREMAELMPDLVCQVINPMTGRL